MMEAKADSPVDVQLPEYTAAEVTSHNRKDDIWIIVHGKVFDITNYLQDHPGGAEILLETAGTDATEAFEDVGHSEDSVEIMQEFLIGTLKGAKEYVPPKKVQLVAQKPETVRQPSGSRPVGAIAGVLGVVASILYAYQRGTFGSLVPKNEFGQLIPQYFTGIRLPRGGFTNGFLTAAAISAIVGTAVARQAAKFTKIDSGFLRYPPHIKARSVMKTDPHLAKGFLDAKEFKSLPLVEKDQLSSNVYRFVFALPSSKGVIGLPIGQHVAIRAVVDGATVSRSYTPVSNNLDLGRLELVVKCYPEGLLTGRYLANLKVGDEVEFRGPKGAMRYNKGLCTKLGMVAGGTGITPMYQLIRAICEDERDTTEISLLYANRTEADILLREELEAFAHKYPKNLKLWYMLDSAPDGWAYGTGFVNQEVLNQQLPGPSEDTKVLLCGPPGMVNATKKTLAAMGFQKAGAVSRMSDQIFCF
ncbi:cytochrome B5 [Aspergillus bombycis]|uniref:Cytochrome B5 n=1 Tax=Aspergillus bombycis TaxID=109264 RepID=A0A1F7ZMZ0_9EURO|nr:cytochrome B5 [Aspergillus bombycis]OGM40804.1 cytochrome B5 [Aspergillus bombycis]